MQRVSQKLTCAQKQLGGVRPRKGPLHLVPLAEAHPQALVPSAEVSCGCQTLQGAEDSRALALSLSRASVGAAFSYQSLVILTSALSPPPQTPPEFILESVDFR